MATKYEPCEQCERLIGVDWRRCPYCRAYRGDPDTATAPEMPSGPGFDTGPPSVVARVLVWVLTLAAATVVGAIVGVFLAVAVSGCESYGCIGPGLAGIVAGGPVGLVVGVAFMNRVLPKSPTRRLR